MPSLSVNSDSDDDVSSATSTGRGAWSRAMVYPFHPPNREASEQRNVAPQVTARAVAVEITRAPPAELEKYVYFGGSDAITEVRRALRINGRVMFEVHFDDLHTEMVSPIYSTVTVLPVLLELRRWPCSFASQELWLRSSLPH